MCALAFLADRHTTYVDVDAAWDEWERRKPAWLDDPDRAAHVMLVDRTLRALPDILTGKCRATEVIFPESSMALVEGIYQNNPVADFFNEVLADAVIAYIQAWRKRTGNVPGRPAHSGNRRGHGWHQRHDLPQAAGWPATLPRPDR